MEPKETPATPPAQTPPPAQPPAVNMDEIVARATAEAQAAAQRILSEKTEEIVTNTRQSIADLITGRKEEKTLNPNFVKLVNETDDVLGTVAQVAEERAYNRIKYEQGQERAVNEVFGSRDDLRTSEIAKMAIAGFTNKILQAKPGTELKVALGEAVKLYDAQVKKPELVVNNQPNAVPSSGGGGGVVTSPETKTVEQLDQEEMLANRAEAAAKRRPPTARVQQ